MPLSPSIVVHMYALRFSNHRSMRSRGALQRSEASMESVFHLVELYRSESHFALGALNDTKDNSQFRSFPDDYSTNSLGLLLSWMI